MIGVRACAKIIVLAVIMTTLAACSALPPSGPALPAATQTLRVATFNVAMEEQEGGVLLARLRSGDDQQASRIAAIIQHIRPDILLLNEIDFDAAGAAADAFSQIYLQRDQHGQRAIRYSHRYLAPVNTGVLSGLDLNQDGRVALPEDGWGFGRFPGQYGMLVLSRHPIDLDAVRTFQLLRWASMPGALQPRDPDSGQSWYPDAVWQQLRLSSKSHWDVPIDVAGQRIHVLAAHPTPPVFDGPEDRNGHRNHDEIRLWADYLSPERSDWIVDDQGRPGGLDDAAQFVILGDYNADPADGETVNNAIGQLLNHPRVLRYSAPESRGAIRSAQQRGGRNLAHRGNPAHDTGQFHAEHAGNLRVDYVLPSEQLVVRSSGVFWPLPGELGSDWIEASDHRMVWVDIEIPAPSSGR